MGKWLAKFSGDIPESRTAIADIVPTLPALSALAVPHLEVSAKISPSPQAEKPTPPMKPGWLVVYRNHEWVLCGGCDDRQHGTVQECRWRMGAWTVHLTDGQWLPLASIRSVGKTDGEGKLVAAWTVREHGYDGTKEERSPVVGEAISSVRTCEEALPVTKIPMGGLKKNQ